MGWVDSSFRKRVALSVHNSGGASPVDVSYTVTSDFDDFWDNVDTATYIRVTGSNGVTILDYQIDDGTGGAADIANKAMRIRIDAASVVGDSGENLLFWLYYDTGGVAVSDESVSGRTFTSVLTANAFQGGVGAHLIRMRPALARSTRPIFTIHKQSDATEMVFLDVTPLLGRRVKPSQGRMVHEEIRNTVVSAVDEGGSAANTVIDRTKVRFVEINRRMYIRVPVTAGSSGTNYTVQVLTKTILPPGTETNRSIQLRFGMTVQNLQEPA